MYSVFRNYFMKQFNVCIKYIFLPYIKFPYNIGLIVQVKKYINDQPIIKYNQAISKSKTVTKTLSVIYY